MYRQVIKTFLVPVLAVATLASCGDDELPDETIAIRVSAQEIGCTVATGGFAFEPGEEFPFWVTNEHTDPISVEVFRLADGATHAQPEPADEEPVATVDADADSEVETDLTLDEVGEYYVECEGTTGELRGGSFFIDDGTLEPRSNTAAEPAEPVDASLDEEVPVETGGAAFTVTAHRMVEGASRGIGDEPGTPLVSLEVGVRNEGDETWRGSVISTATLVTADGDEILAMIDTQVGCPSFDTQLALPAGDARLGCVTFEAPAGTVAETVEASVGPLGGTKIRWDLTESPGTEPTALEMVAGEALGTAQETADPAVEVTVSEIADPVAGDIMGPSDGNHYVTASYELRADPDEPFEIGRGAVLTIVGTEGREYGRALFDAPSCEAAAIGSSVAAGETLDACATFEVPDGFTPAFVQFALPEGDPLRWDVG